MTRRSDKLIFFLSELSEQFERVSKRARVSLRVLAAPESLDKVKSVERKKGRCDHRSDRDSIMLSKAYVYT